MEKRLPTLGDTTRRRQETMAPSMASFIMENGNDPMYWGMGDDDDDDDDDDDEVKVVYSDVDEDEEDGPIQPLVIPETVKVLIVGDTIDWSIEEDRWGGDMSDEDYCKIFTAPLIAELTKRNIAYGKSTLNVKCMCEALRSNTYTAVFVADITQQDERTDRTPFFNEKFKTLLIEWTGKGGTLVLRNGAKEVFGDWFGKPWSFEGDFYRRTDHLYQHACGNLLIPSRAKQELPVGYNVKACMLSHVPDDEKLYTPAEGAVAYSLIPLPGFAGTKIEEDMCAIAVGRFREGTLIYCGDVNAEAATNKIIATLLSCRLLPIPIAATATATATDDADGGSGSGSGSGVAAGTKITNDQPSTEEGSPGKKQRT